MRQTQVCAHGHRWDPIVDGRTDVQARWNVCPVCGGSVEVVSVRDADSTPAADTLRAPEPAIPGYEVHSVLGYGGVAVVYKATQLGLNRPVALKMLFAGAQARPDDLARFRREMESAARLDHPHIVRVYEVGERQGLLYAALEYMDKGSLADAVTGNPLPPRRAAELVETLARAVQAAHEQGIVHRDLKPANVLLATPPTELSDAHPAAAAIQLLGVPKVADFGLAKRLHEENRQTRTGAVLGTPSYMAPEQAEGKKDVGPPADVYALGAILYECLCGRPPFAGVTMLETLDLVRSREPAAPSGLVPGVPRELEVVCLKCLAKSPAERYGSARALADDLRRFLDGHSVLARPTPPWRRAARWLTRRSASVAVVVLAALLLVALAQPWFARTPPPPAPSGTVAYFGALVKRWGVPVGVGRLTPEQARRRHLVYRFHLRGGVVEKVEAVDRHGNLTPRHPITTYLEPVGRPPSLRLPLPALAFNRPAGLTGTAGVPSFVPCSWEYHRDDRGELIREDARDVAGRVVWRFRPAPRSGDDGGQAPAAMIGHYTDARGFVRTRAGSGASHVEMVFDDGGLTREVRFRNGKGRPRPDDTGTFGRRYEYDDRGLVLAVTFLGPRDQPAPHPLGYARVLRAYDRRGLLERSTYLDLDGNPSRSRLGGHVEQWQYDEAGNPTEVRLLGIDGKELLRGSARISYDRNGNPELLEALGPDPSVPRIAYEHNARGHCVAIRYQDAAGKPTLNTPARCAALALAHDDDGHVTGVTYLGLDGKPIEGKGETGRGKEVRLAVTYNLRGQVLSEATFGVDNQPVADRLGVARTTYAYDDQGRRVQTAFFGPDGKATLGREQAGIRYARQTRQYDDQGNLTEVSCYGLDDRLVHPPADARRPEVAPLVMAVLRWLQFPGPAVPLGGRTTFAYDEAGNLTEVEVFGEGGQRLADPLGVAQVRCAYDQQGNLTELSSFGRDGRRVAHAAGRARLTWAYDEAGNLTEVAAYGPDDRLVAGPDGIARQRRQFDARFNPISDAFVGANGRPSVGRFGYARVTFQYDDRGTLTGSIYYGLDDRPVLTRVVWLVEGDRGPGLRPGDVLISYDGQEVHCARMFEQMKSRETQGGPPRELIVQRGGKSLTVRLPGGPLRGDELMSGFRRWRWRSQQTSVPGQVDARRFFETRERNHLMVR